MSAGEEESSTLDIPDPNEPGQELAEEESLLATRGQKQKAARNLDPAEDQGELETTPLLYINENSNHLHPVHNLTHRRCPPDVPHENVLGTELQPAGHDREKGLFLDGYAHPDNSYKQTHLLVGIMTEKYFEYNRDKGFDISDKSEFVLPGLRVGERWLVCAETW